MKTPNNFVVKKAQDRRKEEHISTYNTHNSNLTADSSCSIVQSRKTALL
jgi:hypothetical protein